MGLGLVLQVMTLGWWIAARAEHRRVEEARFGRLAERVMGEIEDSFRATEQALMGLRGLVNSSRGRPTAAAWAFQARQMEEYVGEGLEGLGYVRPVIEDRLEWFEGAQRLEVGYGDFVAQRVGERVERWIVANYVAAVGGPGGLGFGCGGAGEVAGGGTAGAGDG